LVLSQKFELPLKVLQYWLAQSASLLHGAQMAPVPVPLVPVEPVVPPGGQTQLPEPTSQLVTGAQSESSLQPGALSQNGAPPLKSLQRFD